VSSDIRLLKCSIEQIESEVSKIIGEEKTLQIFDFTSSPGQLETRIDADRSFESTLAIRDAKKSHQPVNIVETSIDEVFNPNALSSLSLKNVLSRSDNKGAQSTHSLSLKNVLSRSDNKEAQLTQMFNREA